jgi:hypothetical protein
LLKQFEHRINSVCPGRAQSIDICTVECQAEIGIGRPMSCLHIYDYIMVVSRVPSLHVIPVRKVSTKIRGADRSGKKTPSLTLILLCESNFILTSLVARQS